MVYLDNSATTGFKPRSVKLAVNEALTYFNVNPGRSGYDASIKCADMIFSVREKLKEFFKADAPENVVFTPGCTFSLNYIIKGILKKEDHCIVSDMEHNAVMRPLYKTGCSFDTAQIDLFDSLKTVNNFERLIRPETKLIICTAASNVFGTMPPIDKIGEVCKKHNILFAVDAAQAAGVYPINMERENIDFLCIAGHKGLYAPAGIGVLIARGRIPDTTIEGGTGTFSEMIEQPEIMPEMFESGTLNIPGIMGLGAGIDFVKKIGIEKIYGHEMKLIKKVNRELSDNEKVILYAEPSGTVNYCPVLSFNITGKLSGETEGILNANNIAVRSGLHCAPFAHRKMNTLDTGTVRISPCAFTKENDIDYFLNVIQKTIKKI